MVSATSFLYCSIVENPGLAGIWSIIQDTEESLEISNFGCAGPSFVHEVEMTALRTAIREVYCLGFCCLLYVQFNG